MQVPAFPVKNTDCFLTQIKSKACVCSLDNLRFVSEDVASAESILSSQLLLLTVLDPIADPEVVDVRAFDDKELVELKGRARFNDGSGRVIFA